MLSISENVFECGYIIFWSIKYIPQIYKNIKKQNTEGLSKLYIIFDNISFLSYFTYILLIGHSNKCKYTHFIQSCKLFVNLNLGNVIFSQIGLLLSFFILIQIWHYNNQYIYKENNKTYIYEYIIYTLFITIIILFTIFASVYSSLLQLFVILLIIVRLISFTIKYIPQLYLNYKNKSIFGFSITSSILDVIGGFLIFVYSIICLADYTKKSLIFGAIIYMILGIIAILFNIIFFVQYFIYHNHNNEYISLLNKQYVYNNL